MQIVINIPQPLKEAINIDAISEETVSVNRLLINAVKNGIVIPEKHGRLGDLDDLYNRIDRFDKQHNLLLNDVQFIIDEILNGIKESETLIESSDN